MPRSTSMLTEHHPLSGTPIAIDGGKSLSIRRAEDCARFSLRIAVEHAGEAAAAFGCDLPRAIGGMTSSAGKLSLCLGPDAWHLMAPAGQEDDITRRFDALYAQVPHSLVDIGHRETAIAIGVPAPTLVPAAACPLDLAGMPAGTGTRTLFDTGTEERRVGSEGGRQGGHRGTPDL